MLDNIKRPGASLAMRIFSSAHAKNRFGELIDAARLAPVAITKYDRPFVVVMSAEEFERLSAGRPRPGTRDKATISPRRS